MDPFFSYGQKSGEIAYHTEDNVQIIGTGWAGNHAGKNNPDMQAVPKIGPLPEGTYAIGPPFEHPKTGPFSMRLSPSDENKMFGRDGFLIHGPAKDPEHYGQESMGCIVAARGIREEINRLGSKIMVVINA
jgi:hypothetical protein